jgi:hypothetical protein
MNSRSGIESSRRNLSRSFLGHDSTLLNLITQTNGGKLLSVSLRVAEIAKPFNIKRLCIVLMMCREALSLTARTTHVWTMNSANPQRQVHDLASVNLWAFASWSISPLFPEFLKVSGNLSGRRFTTFTSVVFLISRAYAGLCVTTLALRLKAVWGSPVGVIA